MMSPTEESKLDRALEMLVRLDEKLTLGTAQLADHEKRLRRLEERPGIRWRDLASIASAGAASAAVIIALQELMK